MPRRHRRRSSAPSTSSWSFPCGSAPCRRWWYLAHGLKGLERNIPGFVGIKPIRETLFGMVGAADAAQRQKWLKRMRDLGEKGA